MLSPYPEPTPQVLTPLGVHLSKLPVDVRIGKLLLLGAIFDVPDECLTIAAVLSCRSPFLSPFEKRDEVKTHFPSFTLHISCTARACLLTP
jgi:HrpA-like RNA helicase